MKTRSEQPAVRDAGEPADVDAGRAATFPPAVGDTDATDGGQIPPAAGSSQASAPAHDSIAVTRLRRQLMLLGLGCGVALVVCLVLGSANRRLTAELVERRDRAQQLAADARAIVALRQRPQEVSEAGLPDADLLERVNHAMQTAQLEPEALVSTLPQPPRTRPGAAQAEVVNRLLFENVRLEPLLRFAHELVTANAELRVSAVQFRAGRDEQRWNADVSVTYWVLDPHR